MITQPLPLPRPGRRPVGGTVGTLGTAGTAGSEVPAPAEEASRSSAARADDDAKCVFEVLLSGATGRRGPP
ncbi:hypothetical protein [Streptomyces sp. NPDC002328]|uniref:hypothetical protein n=1 Tax=Streptomyces sp. NPDC002328 TaxID=3364642 RepID=UPI0036796EF5